MGTGGDIRQTVRTKIMESASLLFANHGYQSITTREIAEAAGMDQMELFHYFASKDEIMNALLKADLETAVEAIEHELQQTGSAGERLFRYLLVDLELVCRSPFNLAGVATPGVRRDLSFAGARARHQHLCDARVQLIAEGIESGEFAPGDAEAAGRAIEWTITGALRDIAGWRVPDPASIPQDIADLCLRALIADHAGIDQVREAALRGRQE